ncbi:EpsG family protein [Xenorhabdus bovienii]|uniref:EpsG family protein n=1 Tax=Xenorhabdus bovienii TaxID=40576 RepID=A0AAJ1MZA2_XENBV|nr:EpsG family protein [Xenorhabdus bovienii]MDE1474602.1 EpsG family protein [Xenorhabdus bovienii]MDE1478540.1 EpsG family protein [Xenorhabdus bovienii]MDE9510258.1 EpsG family protein [Xenorhabdus bovienii]MDE9521899.1 EpsG family protein [Xenorhabdus bovienii]
MIYFYSFAYALCAFFALIETNTSKQDRYIKIIFVLIVSLLLSVAILLKPIGLGFDDFNYLTILEMQCDTCNMVNPLGWEPGFMLLISIAAWFNELSFHALIIMVFFICYFFNTFVFYKFSPIISISILWYLSHLFFYKEITQYRSAIAYSIIFLGFYFLYINKTKLFLLSILLATLFHFSALIAVIAYLGKRLGTKKLFYILLFSILLSFSGILNFLLTTLSSIFLNENAFNAYVLDKMGFAKSLGLLNPTTIKYLLFSLFFYSIRNKFYNYPAFNFILSMYMIAPIWIIIFSEFGTLAGRPASIFSIFEGILLSHSTHLYTKNLIIKRTFIIFLSITLLLINLLVIKPINTNYLF